MFFLGLIITVLAFASEVFFDLNLSFVAFIGFVLAALSIIIPRNPKFKNRELVCEYELLPIAENIYAINLYDGKIICKYIDGDNEAKIQAVDSYWREINEIETREKACVKYYERKPKFTFSSSPFLVSREEVEINIPKGTIIS